MKNLFRYGRQETRVPGTKTVLRLVSLAMLVIAVVFVLCALSNPQLGRVIHIGGFEFGPEQWRVCYAVYALVTVGLFFASFFVSDRRGGR